MQFPLPAMLSKISFALNLTATFCQHFIRFLGDIQEFMYQLDQVGPIPCYSKVGDLKASREHKMILASLGCTQAFPFWLQLFTLLLNCLKLYYLHIVLFNICLSQLEIEFQNVKSFVRCINYFMLSSRTVTST